MTFPRLFLSSVSSGITSHFALKAAAVLTLAMGMTGCGGDTYSADELAALYPQVAAGSTTPEDAEILCPFQRMIKRSGLLDDVLADGEFEVRNRLVTEASEIFGCASGACGTFVGYASLAQGNWNTLELNRLHEAGFLSHDCGLTFELGSITVDDSRRDFTLGRLTDLAVDGTLSLDNLMQVKQEICDLEGVEMTIGGETEVKLIYAYLGGSERGYVMNSDVSRFLHATLPAYKSSEYIDFSVVSE